MRPVVAALAAALPAALAYSVGAPPARTAPAAHSHSVAGVDVVGAGVVPYGFAAAPGWDPATGLGTPHFDKLLAAALKA